MARLSRGAANGNKVVSERPAVDEAVAARVALRLRRSGLREPARLLLDAGAPLALIGSQFLYIAQPVLALFTDRQDVAAFARLLEHPDGPGLLAQHLE